MEKDGKENEGYTGVSLSFLMSEELPFLKLIFDAILCDCLPFHQDYLIQKID